LQLACALTFWWPSSTCCSFPSIWLIATNSQSFRSHLYRNLRQHLSDLAVAFIRHIRPLSV
jgi:hypothetical protein